MADRFYALIILFSGWAASAGLMLSVTRDTVLVAAMSLGIYYWGARSACRRLTLAETKKSKGEQYGVGNSIVT